MIDNSSSGHENHDFGKSSASDETKDLSEEELKNVLEQLTDHTVPDRDKCSLVRRLNAENKSKEDEFEKVLTRSLQRTAPTLASNSVRNHRKQRLQRSSSKDAEKSNGSGALVGKAVHSSQSLQDLMSASSYHPESDSSKQALMRSIGANHNRGAAGKLAPNRHNPSSSQLQFYNNNNNNNNNSKDFSEVLSSDYSQTQVRLHQTSSQMQTPLQNSFKAGGVRNKSLKGQQHVTTTSMANANSSIDGDGLGESGLCEPTTNSSRTFHECFATQPVVNHNMDSCDTNCTPLCNSCAPTAEQKPQYIEMSDLRQKAQLVEYTSDSTRNYIPVDTFANLGLKAVTPRDPIRTGVAERVANHSCDYDGVNSHASDDNNKFQDVVKPYDPSVNSVTNQDPDLSQANHNNFNNTQNYPSITGKDQLNRNGKKKKAKDVPTKLAQDIEGYIGYIEDVDKLEALINSSGNEPVKPSATETKANSSVKDSAKKKEKSSQMTNSVAKGRKNGSTGNQSASQYNNTSSNKSGVSPNIPLSNSSSSFSGDEANSVSKHSDFAQRTDSLTRETTSPLISSAESKSKTTLNADPDLDADEDEEEEEDENISMSNVNSSSFLIGSSISADLLCTASDSEMADREKGFVTPKSKHFKRRNQMRRIGNQMTNKSRSMQSSTSTTPSTTASTMSGGGVGYRGYESEREYQYIDDYRRHQNSSVCSRRKSLSSVPHSEHNSAYNSDGELSSHSMPIRNDSLNTETTGNSDTRTTSSSISSTPKASYADIAKTTSAATFGPSSSMIGVSAKRPSLSTDVGFTVNTTTPNPVSTPLSVQYQDFPQLDLSLPPVVDVSTPSSPNNSKIIEALVSPPQKSVVDRLASDSCSAPTSMTNTPVPHNTEPTNECLFSETLKDTNSDETTDQTDDDTVVPAVIMCDYSESVPLSDIGSVTFGFFDEDMSANSGPQNSNQIPKTPILNEIVNEPELKAKSPIKTSPETKSHVNSPKVSGVELTYIDVDKKSFNYEHIIGFIKKAWDNAKRDYQYQSYESSPTVK